MIKAICVVIMVAAVLYGAWCLMCIVHMFGG
jgi:hypothetical protein